MRLIMVTALILSVAGAMAAQKRGVISGVVKPPTPGVVVVATNQVTSGITRARVDSEGRYSLRVPAGAYRLSVELPFVARFDKTRSYGEHALVRDDSIENLIVDSGKQITIDFAIERQGDKPIAASERSPLGAAGPATINSAPQTQPDRREVRDRWRIGFPEYDRYGDKGARGRDIPFKQGHWYDPYHQNKIKGDYPIIGNRTFMILSAVSFTATELSRTPKPSDVSSAQPGSAEFLGGQKRSP